MGTYFPLFGSGESKYGVSGDVENALYPGISATDNIIRLGFIRKVFGIVTAQLLLTAIIAVSLLLSPSTQQMLASSVGIQIALMLFTLLGLIPLYIYKDKHPTNLILLAFWTSAFGVTVGLSCTFFAPAIVIQALVITVGVVAALTAYTFYASKQGVEFTWMAPLLGSALWALVIWSFLQIFIRPGPIGQTIFSLLGALLFCGYLVLDIHLLATRLDPDDYIWASVALYLDVLNLFLYILRLLGQNQGDS